MTKKELATLVLDPKRWYRGQGTEHSKLLRDDGTMCCLGFECRRRRVPKKDILGVAVPSVIGGKFSGEPWVEIDPETAELDLEDRIACINDATDIPLTRAGDRKRVAKLRPLFLELGVNLVLGEYEK